MLEPAPERHRRLRQAPVGQNVERHRPHRPAGLVLGATALQQPPLVGIRVRVVAHGLFQDRALDSHSDRVGRGVPLPSTAASLGSLEGREEAPADLGRPQGQ